MVCALPACGSVAGKRISEAQRSSAFNFGNSDPNRTHAHTSHCNYLDM